MASDKERLGRARERLVKRGEPLEVQVSILPQPVEMMRPLTTAERDAVVAMQWANCNAFNALYEAEQAVPGSISKYFRSKDAQLGLLLQRDAISQVLRVSDAVSSALLKK